MKRRNQKAPHVLAHVESEALPEFRYEACPYNPLRIIVRNAEGEILPERSIMVIAGSRENLLWELQAKTAPIVYKNKRRHTAGLEWGTR
jgi:hypothetical protein